MLSVLTWGSHHFGGKSGKRNWIVRVVFLGEVYDLGYQCSQARPWDLSYLCF